MSVIVKLQEVPGVLTRWRVDRAGKRYAVTTYLTAKCCSSKPKTAALCVASSCSPTCGLHSKMF